MSRKTVTFLFLVFTSFALVDDSNGEICERIADVVFVIDASRSIWPPNFHKQLDFVKQVVQTFDIGLGKTRIGVLTFSDRTKKEFHMNTHDNKQDILDAITNIHFAQGDETNTFDALMVLRTDFFSERNGDRSGVPNIAIVLTDGESSDNDKTVHEANLTRKAGVVMFAIGIGANVNKTELEEIANSPKSDYMHALENFNDLQSDTFKKLLSHTVCNVCQKKPVDVMFVLDVSGSLYRTDFTTQIRFVKSIVEDFDMDSGMVQVGVITFSKNAYLQFQLGKHKSKNATLDAIDRVNFYALSTNTAEALLVLLKQFQPHSGSRQGVDRIAFVITDGKSDDPVATEKMAKNVHEDGIDVSAIGVGNKYNITELHAIASKPTDQHVYLVNDYNALSSIKNYLASKACEG